MGPHLPAAGVGAAAVEPPPPPGVDPASVRRRVNARLLPLLFTLALLCQLDRSNL